MKSRTWLTFTIKRIVALISSFMLSLMAFSQNLVLNPSFESVNLANLQCTPYNGSAQFNAAINSWTLPTEGTSDIYHNSLPTTCNNSPQSTSGFRLGQQNPHIGNSHAGIYTLESSNLCYPGNTYREYLQGILSTQLVPGQTYKIEMYVSLADSMYVGTNNIGVRFLTSPVSIWDVCVYNTIPHVNYSGSPITDKANWTKLSFCFTPSTGGLKYFMIGNFYNNTQTLNAVASPFGTNLQTRSYYYIDDVSIELSSNASPGTNGSVSLCPNDSSLNLFSQLGGNPSITGTWSGPSSLSGGYLGTFDPNTNTPGTYTYTISSCSPGNIPTSEVTVTFNTPPNVSINQPPIFCENVTSVQLTSSSPGGIWSASCGNCISSSGIFNPNTAGSGSYNVTYSVSGSCLATDTKTVNVVASPIVTASNDITICANDSTLISATGASFYTWTSSNTLFSASGDDVIVTPSTGTTYTVVGTDGNGCTGQDQVVVSLFDINVGNDTAICFGSSASLTVIGSSFYTWYPLLGLTTNNINNSIVEVSPDSSTLYSVTSTDVNGCVATDSILIIVHPLPTVSTGNNISICINDSTILYAHGADTYQWSPSQGLSSNTGDSITVSPMNTITYSVVGIDVNGCQDDDEVTVSINPLPNLVVSPDTSICLGDSVLLSASGAIIYEWFPSIGLSNTVGQYVISNPTNTVTYSVTGIDGNGCSDQNQLVVEVIHVTVGNDTTICSGASIQLEASGANTYIWSPMTGLVSSSPDNSSVTASPDSTITYTVTGAGANSCPISDQVTITVHESPKPSFTVSLPLGCVPLSTNFIYTGSPVISYEWIFGNGEVSYESLPSAIYNQQGVYSITLNVVDIFGCSSAYSQQDIIEVLEPIFAAFDVNPQLIWEDNSVVTVNDQSQNATTWQYYISDGNSYYTASYSHEFSDTGHYNIIQVVGNDAGCKDSASFEVIVNPLSSIYIPNAFIPESYNDCNKVFKVYGYGLNEVELKIFNRWGELIFKSIDQSTAWDGTLEGVECAADTYIYTISFRNHKNQLKYRTGSFILIR